MFVCARNKSPLQGWKEIRGQRGEHGEDGEAVDGESDRMTALIKQGAISDVAWPCASESCTLGFARRCACEAQAVLLSTWLRSMREIRVDHDPQDMTYCSINLSSD